METESTYHWRMSLNLMCAEEGWLRQSLTLTSSNWIEQFQLGKQCFHRRRFESRSMLCLQQQAIHQIDTSSTFRGLFLWLSLSSEWVQHRQGYRWRFYPRTEVEDHWILHDITRLKVKFSDLDRIFSISQNKSDREVFVFIQVQCSWVVLIDQMPVILSDFFQNFLWIR